MQISNIQGFYPKTSFKCNSCYDKNQGKIFELEQKREQIRWGTEGCNGDLSPQDNHELSLRREYQRLLAKHAALQWGSEGCNGGLNFEDAQRMREIEAELVVLAKEENTEHTCCCEEKKCDCYESIPSGNIYGVPDSTFYGDWAR